MKVTIDISGAVVRQARSLAARKKTTLGAIVNQALRDALARERLPSPVAKLQTRTFRGEGLQQGLSWDDWGAIRALAYRAEPTP